MMGVLILLRNTPRGTYYFKPVFVFAPIQTTVPDKWEWGTVITRIVGGLFLVSLSIFDIHYTRPIETELFHADGTMTDVTSDSLIWKYAQSGWM